MENREFASYAYQFDNSMAKVIGLCIATVCIAVVAASAVSPWFLALLVIPPALYIRYRNSGLDKPLVIAGRYLILGEQIIYYRTVTRTVLDRKRQTLTLTSGRGKTMVIEADKFPTNARKPDKVRANKKAKFDKVTGKIIARLNEASPGLVVA